MVGDRAFESMGTTCRVVMTGPDAGAAVAAAADHVRAAAAALTRFESGSELSRLNADPRGVVPCGALLRGFVRAAVWAGEATGGLVDPTLLDELIAGGYSETFGPGGDVRAALAVAPPRRAAAGRRGWDGVRVDEASVARPAGLRFDAGGIAKGLIADRIVGRERARELVFADCGGDGGGRGRGGSARARARVRRLRRRRGGRRHGGFVATLDRGGAPPARGCGRASVRARPGWRGHVRHRPAGLAAPGRQPGAPPARPVHGRAGVDGAAQRDGGGPERRGGRGAGQGGVPERGGGGAPVVVAARRAARARGRGGGGGAGERRAVREARSLATARRANECHSNRPLARRAEDFLRVRLRNPPLVAGARRRRRRRRCHL